MKKEVNIGISIKNLLIYLDENYSFKKGNGKIIIQKNSIDMI